MIFLEDYVEGNSIDLLNAAMASLDSFEKAKSVKMNFFFHDDSIRHLARLTRLIVIIL